MNVLPLSGSTACLAKAGLAEGTNSATIKINAPNGAGIDFVINGKCYHKADTDNISVTAHAAQADLTTCLYLVQINSSGTVSTKKGKEVLTASLAHLDSLQWPLPDADLCPIGGYKVKCATATYTNGTTDHSASGITVNYVDFALGMPDAPETTTSA
jgi:hypothetical protein